MLPNQNIEELNLLKRLKKGDEAAFEILYNIYKGRLYSFSIKLVKSDDLACDIIHDVFVKVWEKRKQINHESNFSSYLHTICKNRIFNFLKQASRRDALKLEIIQYTSNRQNRLEDDLHFNEYEKIANEAVNKLPPRRKTVFQMCKFDGKSYEETASDLGISRNAVKDHIVKASKFIKNYFQEHAEVSF